MQDNNTAALRDWLRRCPAIGAKRAFGVDWLADEPGSCALCAVQGAPAVRENIIGELSPSPRQARDFLLALRAPAGPETGPALNALGLFGAVAAWLRQQNAEGSLPQWEGGVVSAVVPMNTGAPERFDGDTARYELRLQVRYVGE